MCGIVCRHAFCGLKQIGVTKFPRSLMLNRWMKIAESGTSSAALSVSEDYLKMEEVSLKITNMWFDFRQLVNKAGVHLEKLDVVHQTVLQLTADLESSNEHAEFTKRDHLAAMVGDQPTGPIEVLAPNVCKNKGNFFKRLISDREKAINKSKKRTRKCKLCSATTHDSRTCAKRQKV